jgi:hypothetical protein
MGLFGCLSGGKAAPSAPSPPKKLTVDRAFQIIRLMGKFMETDTPAPGTVADEKKLPLTKEQIRAAVLVALSAANTAKEKELLKYLFLELASWQPDVGETDVGLDASLVDVSKLDSNEALVAHAKRFLDARAEFAEWEPLIEDERSKAQKTLARLGFW